MIHTHTHTHTHTQLDAGKKKSENISAQLSSSVQACKTARQACRELEDKNALLNEALRQQVLACVLVLVSALLNEALRQQVLLCTRTGTQTQAHHRESDIDIFAKPTEDG